MLLPRSFNSRVQIFTSNAGNIGRISYNPKAPAKIHEMQAEMESNNEVNVLRTMTYSMTQFTENNFKGEALFLSFRAPILRGWEIMKLVKNGMDPHEHMMKSWMYESDENAELIEALTEFIDAYQACEAKITFGLIKNAYVWEINAGEQKLPVGSFLVFDPITNEAGKYITKSVNPEDGEVTTVVTELEVPVTADIKLRGEYEITMYGNQLAVKRHNNSKEMIDVLKAIDMAKALVPEMSVETAEVITGTDGF